VTDRFRKIIAGSEIAGGAVVMVLTLWPVLQRVLPAWYLISTEGLGAMAIAAGLWLWRDEDRGWTLSRLLQGLQVAQIWTPGFSFVVVVGLQCNLYVGATQFGIQPGFYGSLVLGNVYRGEWKVALNLFALAAFVALWRSRQSAPSQCAPVGAHVESETTIAHSRSTEGV
jgi:hypothetical protein